MSDLRAAEAAFRARRNGHVPEERRVFARTASSITPEPVRFLWADRFPLGATALLAGEGGLGKSTLLQLVHADLSRGKLEGELHGEPADSLIVTSEDHAASVVIPRLIAAGADMDRVHVVGVEVGGSGGLVTFPDDLAAIEGLIVKYGARLLSIDPVVASLSGAVDSHKDHSIRRVLGPLAQLAERFDVAIAGVIHMNKSAVSDVLNRVSGSKGFVNAARSVLVFDRDPDDPDGEEGDRRVLVHAKSNWARLAPSLAATVEVRLLPPEQPGAKPIETCRLVITGESAVTRADISGRDAPEGSDKTELARHWLLERLGRDSWHESAALKVEADAAGHAPRTLQRAFAGLLKEGAGEHKREGFPASTYWLVSSRANLVAPTPDAQLGAAGETRIAKPNPGGPASQSRQILSLGATGASAAPTRQAEEAAERILGKARSPRCTCASGPGSLPAERLADGRCGRCYGCPS